MAKLRLQVVTAERVTYDNDVDIVVAPGAAGELGILPMHAPLLTKLAIGSLRARTGQDEVVMALSGGFLEVYNDKVIVLAEAAERAEEIDVARAEAARERALARLREARSPAETLQAAQALQRSAVRLRTARRRRRPMTEGEGRTP